MQLDSRQTILMAVLVLFLGKYLNNKIGIFRKYNIPEPVTGGFIASLLFGLIYLIFGFDIKFATHYRDILLIVFFTAIGLSTEFKSILKGGKVLIVLSIFALAYIFVENYIAIGLAKIFNLHSAVGILAGSAALQGGHGNVVSWVPVINEKFNIENTMEIGMIMATFGLIVGGILGGPISKYLIKKYNLKPEAAEDENVTIGTKRGKKLSIDYDSMLGIMLYLAFSIGLGLYFQQFLEYVNFTLPLFATCMLGGVILVNVVPLIRKKWALPHNSPTLAVTSELSLGLFLAMAMMSLKFWEIGSESLYIVTNLVAQTIVIVLFTIFILFRVLGKNYTAAVIASGYIGSALGATPTAMANMAAVTQENGPSPIAFAVIPILGAFIVQVSNAVVINIVLMWIG